MSIGFTHHCQIITSVKDRDECLYYIRRAATEHYRAEDLRRSIRNDDYRHRSLGLASDHDPPVTPPARLARSAPSARPSEERLAGWRPSDDYAVAVVDLVLDGLRRPTLERARSLDEPLVGVAHANLAVAHGRPHAVERKAAFLGLEGT